MFRRPHPVAWTVRQLGPLPPSQSEALSLFGSRKQRPTISGGSTPQPSSCTGRAALFRFKSGQSVFEWRPTISSAVGGHMSGRLERFDTSFSGLPSSHLPAYFQHGTRTRTSSLTGKRLFPPSGWSRAHQWPKLRRVGCGKHDGCGDDDTEGIARQISLDEAQRLIVHPAPSAHGDWKGFTSWTRSQT